jgi:hypothetical protein
VLSLFFLLKYVYGIYSTCKIVHISPVNYRIILRWPINNGDDATWAQTDKQEDRVINLNEKDVNFLLRVREQLASMVIEDWSNMRTVVA